MIWKEAGVSRLSKRLDRLEIADGGAAPRWDYVKFFEWALGTRLDSGEAQLGDAGMARSVRGGRGKV